MTSALGSVSVSGLLGGTAGQIDTNALVATLMQAQALPQTRLKNQLAIEQAIKSAYQSINTRLSAVQTAAQTLTDPATWTATTATSSVTSVVATSNGSATAGSTTFDVLQVASAQVSTVAANASGVVVSVPSAGITVTDSTGTAHPIALTSGLATDVAAAINTAGIGVRAVVVNSTTGQLLQLSSASTGAAGAFTASGFDVAAQAVVTARDAQVGVGNPASGGYVVSSATNTFTGFIPGVTFTVSAPATGVTVSVANDAKSITDKVKALVDAANAATKDIGAASGKGAILQGNLDVQTVGQGILRSVSNGTLSGASLKTYGIDVDAYGVLSFDAGVFAAKYAADPAGTQTAVAGSFAAALTTTAGRAIDPTTGTITQAINSADSQATRLNKQIDDWTVRLTDIQTTLQLKFTHMQSMLAKLQSQSTYLSSMLKSINSGSSSNGSG